MLAGCAAEQQACPTGALGCPCLPDGDCNAGFECAADRICRDDEPPDTDDTTATETTLATSDETSASTVDATIDPPVTTTFTSTETGETTSVSLPCVCGWSDTQLLYTCGEGLPPDGPGQPVCPTEGFLVGGPCDSVDPPITAEGCCLSMSYLAFCHPQTSTIELQQCLETEFGCVPASSSM